MNQSRKITEGALSIVILVVILVAALFPILNVITVFVLPVPFIFYVKRHGVEAGLVMTVAAGIITALLMSFTLPMILVAAAGGIMIGYAMRKKNTAYEILSQGTFGFIVGMLISFVFIQMISDVNIVTAFGEVVEDSVNISTSMIEDVNPALNSEEVQTMMREQVDLLKKLIPTFIVIFSFILAFITQWVSYKLFNRFEKEKMYFPPFRELQFPGAIIWLYLLALVLSIIDFESGSILQFGAQNLLMIVGIALALQGFSFIFYFANIKGIPKVVPILIVIATILFPTFLLYFVRILGIIDIGLRLRGRLK